MICEPQGTALAHDSGFAADAIEQRTKGARRDVIRQPRAERFHLEPGSERLVPMIAASAAVVKRLISSHFEVVVKPSSSPSESRIKRESLSAAFDFD